MREYLKSIIDRSAGKSQETEHTWERGEQGYARSRKNLWGLIIFLLISIDAYSFRHINLFEISSEPIRQLLGTPPPAFLISLALAVYCFSAVLMSLTSIAKGIRPSPSWKHLFYRTIFYLFYSFCGALAAHHLPVLLIGLFLYGLEQVHVWVYNAKAVEQHKELLG